MISLKRRRGAQTVILEGEARDPAVYALLERRGIRYACAYVHHPASPHSMIGFDNRNAMNKVVEYLHDLGHRLFAIVAGLADGNDRASERIAGVREALERKGLRLAPGHLPERPYSMPA